jgi:hypothetical protein
MLALLFIRGADDISLEDLDLRNSISDNRQKLFDPFVHPRRLS